ncbi:MAG: hypothetical protein H0W64_00645 [Gammaproteobacteria bacterium]|nr:hypothetical protein [Gammaproteobacteria bacterium]
MPKMEPLCSLLGINSRKLNKEENLLLEMELFVQIWKELKNFFILQQQNYFYFAKFPIDKENAVLDAVTLNLIIRDILSTEEYSLLGIAYYTDTHEDIIQDVIIGYNLSPSITFLRKIIELHRLVRRDLYQTIIKKITVEYLTHVGAQP